MDRKRAEGKPYRVYMMAFANKFLRIHYATVKKRLDSIEIWSQPKSAYPRQALKIFNGGGSIFYTPFAVPFPSI